MRPLFALYPDALATTLHIAERCRYTLRFGLARREEVIQYLYQCYGAEHVTLACTFITFQARSALNEVAKALGLDPTALQHAEPGLDVARLQVPGGAVE